jgi:hypothetical protein
VVHTCNPNYFRRQKQEDNVFQANPDKVNETLSQKQNKIKYKGPEA